MAPPPASAPRRLNPASMSRRTFLAAAGLGAAGAWLCPPRTGAEAPAPGAARPDGRPNILVIVADDLGYAELGIQGCRDIATPHIDSLAAGGIRFTNGYVSCPVCSPTRAGLFTGRYQQRFGHEFNPGPSPAAGFGLPLTERTLADRMKALGYATGLVGKWHLGEDAAHRPLRRGFDEFFGFLGGAHPYTGLKRSSPAPIMRGDEPVDEKEYLTDALAREAVGFVDRHRAAPFLLCLTFNAVHSPMQATPGRLEKLAAIADPARRTFAGMLTAMDDGVGRVLARLREHGLEERTLIVFLSDNGGPTDQTTSRNDPLSGRKGQVLEGGIRVPFLMQWKGRLPGGRVIDDPAISLDIAPTAIAAAGGAVDPAWGLDGVDLLPRLSGEKTPPPHETLYWRYGPQMAVRSGDWKLLRTAADGAHRLVNLAEDIAERRDLAASHPDLVKTMLAAYEGWNAGLAAPLWRAQPRRPPAKARPAGPA